MTRRRCLAAAARKRLPCAHHSSRCRAGRQGARALPCVQTSLVSPSTRCNPPTTPQTASSTFCRSGRRRPTVRSAARAAAAFGRRPGACCSSLLGSTFGGRPVAPTSCASMSQALVPATAVSLARVCAAAAHLQDTSSASPTATPGPPAARALPITSTTATPASGPTSQTRTSTPTRPN